MAARYLHSTTLSCFQPPQAQDANRATAHCNGVMTFVLARVGHHSMQNQHWGLSTAFPCGRCMEACRKWWGKNLWIIPSWKHVSIYIYIPRSQVCFLLRCLPTNQVLCVKDCLLTKSSVIWKRVMFWKWPTVTILIWSIPGVHHVISWVPILSSRVVNPFPESSNL